MVVVALIVVSLLGQVPLLETSSSEWRLWVPWAMFHTGDDADGTQTLIAGNPAAPTSATCWPCAPSPSSARCGTTAPPGRRGFGARSSAAVVVGLALRSSSRCTTGNHDNRVSDPIPSRVTC